MAPGSLSKPGDYENGGPCLEICNHTDCLETRKMAATRCKLCDEVIGFRVLFFREEDGSLVHNVCESEMIEAQNLLDTMTVPIDGGGGS